MSKENKTAFRVIREKNASTINCPKKSLPILPQLNTRHPRAVIFLRSS
jgi:hypothetical protein